MTWLFTLGPPNPFKYRVGLIKRSEKSQPNKNNSSHEGNIVEIGYFVDLENTVKTLYLRFTSTLKTKLLLLFFFNSLPKPLRFTPTLAQFKNNLKTHFFHQAFPECN